MKLKDDRVKMISEVLGGMKVLKLYAWEQPFEDIIISKRLKEVLALRKSLFVEAFLVILFIVAPFFVSTFVQIQIA